jgi:hypothetical protein
MLDGHLLKTIAEAPSAKPDQVTPGYFETMSIRLLKGRVLKDADRMGAPPVVVINETMAKKLWPGVDPIGHTLKMFNDKAPWVTIVGVVADIRSRGFQEDGPPTMFFPHAQSGTSAYFMPSTMTLVVRTVGDPTSVVPAVRAVVRAAESQMPIAQVATMDQVLGRPTRAARSRRCCSPAPRRRWRWPASVSMACRVQRVAADIRDRCADGVGRVDGSCAPRHGEGARMVGGGLALGLAGAVVVDRLLRTLLVGVRRRTFRRSRR